MAWICNWLLIMMHMVVLAIISAENITTTTLPSTPTTSAPSTTLTTLPKTPTTRTTTNTASRTSTTPSVSVSQHTTPDQETITITPVTLGLLVSLAIVGILALILLLFLPFRVLYLRMRKPEREAEQDPMKRLVGLSSHRMSRGPEFLVSPVEIFPVEEVCPVGKEDLDMLILNKLPRKNMQTNDVVHLEETKLDDDNDNNEYHKTASLPMGSKEGDIPEQEKAYVNAPSHKGRKLSNPSLLLDGLPDIKMPTLPLGITGTGTLVEEPRDSKIYDIPFAPSHTSDPAHAPDGPEYAYADLLAHPTADRLKNEDDTDFTVLTGQTEDEYASLHGSEDDYHEYNEPTEMTGVVSGKHTSNHDSDDDYHEYNEPIEMTGVVSGKPTSNHDSDDDYHEYNEPIEMTEVVSCKPTTNHYKNNQMFKTEGRKAHTHRVNEDM